MTIAIAGRQAAVQSRTTDPLPALGTLGRSYIVPAGATGAGAGHDGELAHDRGGSTWEFETPATDHQAGGVPMRLVLDERVMVYWNGAAWQVVGGAP